MKVLLTAGNSFIARNLKEQLVDCDITAPDKKQLDLLDSKKVHKFFKGHHFDVVVHTACVGGRSLGEPESVFHDNIAMFENLLANKEHYDRLINIGSGAEYNKAESIMGVDETFDRPPRDPYGLAKYAIGQTIEKLYFAVNLRCFGVWGKYEKKDRFPAVCHRLNPIPVTELTMSYIKASDLTRVVQWAFGQTEYNTYNVGTRIRLSDFAKQLAPKSELVIKGHGLDYWGDESRLLNEFKY